METLPDWNSLQRLTENLPRSAPGYSTNLYADHRQIEQWCATGQLRALATKDAVLVLRADLDFWRVYHIARDMTALTDALAALPAGRYVTDLIGRSGDLAQSCNAYADGGFVQYAFLRRMNRTRPPSEANPVDDVAVATAEDAEDVSRLLHRLLDRFSEQLPSLDELRMAADHGHLLLVRQETALVGMLMYDLHGQSAHLRFWHVDPVVHGMGVGRRLMRSFLTRCAQTRRITLWVMGDNDRSIAIYRHYGFEADGLVDRIMMASKD